MQVWVRVTENWIANAPDRLRTPCPWLILCHPLLPCTAFLEPADAKLVGSKRSAPDAQSKPTGVADVDASVRDDDSSGTNGRKPRVHYAWQHIALTMAAHLEKLLSAANPKQIFFVGHSLGGALAILLATFWNAKDDGSHAHAVTWAAPCPGDKDFAYVCRELMGDRIICFVNGMDVVPKVPSAMLGFVPAASKERIILLDASELITPLVVPAHIMTSMLQGNRSTLKLAAPAMEGMRKHLTNAHSTELYWKLTDAYIKEDALTEGRSMISERSAKTRVCKFESVMREISKVLALSKCRAPEEQRLIPPPLPSSRELLNASQLQSVASLANFNIAGLLVNLVGHGVTWYSLYQLHAKVDNVILQVEAIGDGLERIESGITARIEKAQRTLGAKIEEHSGQVIRAVENAKNELAHCVKDEMFKGHMAELKGHVETVQQYARGSPNRPLSPEMISCLGQLNIQINVIKDRYVHQHRHAESSQQHSAADLRHVQTSAVDTQPPASQSQAMLSQAVYMLVLVHATVTEILFQALNHQDCQQLFEFISMQIETHTWLAEEVGDLIWSLEPQPIESDQSSYRERLLTMSALLGNVSAILIETSSIDRMQGRQDLTFKIRGQSAL